MTDKPIKTKTIGKDFAKTSYVLLEETADTALVFSPQIHPGGVRGELVRFRKNRSEKWERIPEEDFRKLELYEGTHIVLGTKQLSILLEEVEKRRAIAKEGIEHGVHNYVVADEERTLLIDDQNKKEILEQLLSRGYSQDFWSLLSASDPVLADKLTAGHRHFQREKVVEELKTRLSQTHSETSGEDSWQIWIYKHNWLFGANYQKAISKQKISISGIMPDYLFPTIDSFVDILEIKLPGFEVIEEDPSHQGSWRWSKETNTAIGQVVNYVCEIERLRYEIETAIKKKYDRIVSLLKPRAFILIGQSSSWSMEKMEGLRKLNHSLHGIEVLTYTDLVHRGQTFLTSPPKDA